MLMRPPCGLSGTDVSDHQASIMQMMANPHRLLIVKRLLDGEATATELARHTTFSCFMTSQHLIQMKQAGFLTCRERNQLKYYAIALNYRDVLRALLTIAYGYEPGRLEDERSAS